MIAAVILAMIVMLTSCTKISDFVDRHPTIKMLALSFLFMIGAMLVAWKASSKHIHKGYIYFAMAFSAGVEDPQPPPALQAAHEVHLHQPYR